MAIITSVFADERISQAASGVIQVLTYFFTQLFSRDGYQADSIGE